VLLASTAGAALLLTACSGGIKVASVPTPSTTPAKVTLILEHSPVGPILATGNGFTLYDFALDTRGKSACTSSACVFLWPPLLVTGRPTVGKGVNGSLVGTIRRPGGGIQVTYAGHPLYTWRSDTTPGMVTGQALLNEGGYWYVLGPSGAPITKPFTVTG